ncbi:MAG: 2-C-methyl-D-erythritol 4-phosphate cytidylyltransferase [Lachnospiraceae bacterium]|nr:2-C-methyl-D-erythritol 4-phosphate cytidylyltransferase [Lachnospiraceae bacterium]MCI8958361.1 2-C-methyl-D-erythritol 4-phosphate cytidylyltransferase [Lachnospiraceae bacterium]
MNYGLILAGGVGQRMRTTGMPKQFLEVFGKPIIVYTLEKFEKCNQIDQSIIVCNASWTEYMNDLVQRFHVSKVFDIVPGGSSRQKSVMQGVEGIKRNGGKAEDIIVIHDGVRPLVQTATISENVRIAKKYGNAMTVKPVIESVCITSSEDVTFEDFKKRDDTYSLTSPQTFKLGILSEIYEKTEGVMEPIPILDAAIGYTFLGNKIHVVKENNNNIKITTPEDYYIMKAMLELEENKYIFGL